MYNQLVSAVFQFKKEEKFSKISAEYPRIFVGCCLASGFMNQQFLYEIKGKSHSQTNPPVKDLTVESSLRNMRYTRMYIKHPYMLVTLLNTSN